MANYFNSLSLREQLNQLGVCEFMDINQFAVKMPLKQNVLLGKMLLKMVLKLERMKN